MKKLVKQTYEYKDIVSFGNMFLLANGRYGYRGTLEEYRKSEMVAVNVLGFYDQYQDKWRESINLPNPFYILVSNKDKEYSLLKEKPNKHEISLDIEHAVFSRNTSFDDIDISSVRFVSNNNKDVLGTRYIVKANKDIDINIKMGLDLDIYEINGPHFQKKECEINKDIVSFKGLTNEGKTARSFAKYQINKGNIKEYQQNDIYGYQVDIHLDKDEEVVIEVLYQINGSDLLNIDFEKLYIKHQQGFKDLWNNAYVEILGDEQANFELQYSLYHLLILEDDNSVHSVPARGLSGQTYKGAIFWDTEMFMLPFYTLTNPKFAKNTLIYRINTLDGAKKKAKKYGYKGVFYAWESQDDGVEQCSDYNVTDPITNKPIRTYFADKQIHISGDIALAIDRYISATGDKSILNEGGYEIIYEAIKFYQSYMVKDKGQYHIYDVIGPDEYHERIDDNAYTNMLVKNILEIGINYYQEYIHLIKEASLNKEDMMDMLNNLYIPEPNKEGIIEQFSNYFTLEDVLPEEVKNRKHNDKEYMGGQNGVATKTRVIKQADVLAELILLNHQYDKEILEKNYKFYYPYTEHGSSLSASVYSLAACIINKLDDAYYLFRKSSGIDLGIEQKMYAGGIYIGGTHPASNAGAYLSTIFGFAGLSIKEDGFTIKPNLPPSIKGIRFKFLYKEKQYLVSIKKDNTYTLEEVN